LLHKQGPLLPVTGQELLLRNSSEKGPGDCSAICHTFRSP
jgi:hypothetical protein